MFRLIRNQKQFSEVMCVELLYAWCVHHAHCAHSTHMGVTNTLPLLLARSLVSGENVFDRFLTLNDVWFSPSFFTACI